MANFISHDRSQALVLPHDLRGWAPEDDPCHFIIEAVERIPIGAFKVNCKGTGKARHPPRMMLALPIYCSANRVFSSRRIGKAAFREVAVWFVAADTHPDHDTVATFRREHQAAFAAALASVLEMARELRAQPEADIAAPMARAEAAREKYKRRKCPSNRCSASSGTFSDLTGPPRRHRKCQS